MARWRAEITKRMAGKVDKSAEEGGDGGKVRSTRSKNMTGHATERSTRRSRESKIEEQEREDDNNLITGRHQCSARQERRVERSTAQETEEKLTEEEPFIQEERKREIKRK